MMVVVPPSVSRANAKIKALRRSGARRTTNSRTYKQECEQSLFHCSLHIPKGKELRPILIISWRLSERLYRIPDFFN